eukprot:5033361-Prymnesium_polylepis.1
MDESPPPLPPPFPAPPSPLPQAALVLTVARDDVAAAASSTAARSLQAASAAGLAQGAAALMETSSSPPSAAPPTSGKTFGGHIREWAVASYDVICIITQLCTIVNHILLLVYIKRDLLVGTSPKPKPRGESDALLQEKTPVWPPSAP